MRAAIQIGTAYLPSDTHAGVLLPFYAMKHKLPTIFIGIAAVSSLISQSLLDLFSILSIIMVLWIGFERKIFKELFQKIGIEWAFIGFFITCFIGIVWNTGGFYWEYLKPLVKFNWMIHIYFMIAAFKLWLPKVEDCLKLLLGLSLIPSVYAIATQIAGYDFLVPERALNGRIIGIVNSPTYHAHASSIIFTFCAGLLFFSFNWRKKRSWIFICALTLMGTSIYFTYTKGAILAMILSLLFGLLFINFKRGIIFGLTVLASGFIMVKIDPALKERVSQTVVAEKMDTGRIGLFKAHLNIFQDHPVLGLGYDVYKQSPITLRYTQKHNVPDNLQDSHAHNQYLQTLGSTGFIGFLFFSSIVLFFSWLIIQIFMGNYQNEATHIFKTGVLFAHGCILLLFLTDQSFEYAKIRFLILSIWALITYLQKFKPIKF